MSQKPETLFTNRVKVKLDALPKCWYFKTQMIARLGIPDIIGVINGQFFAFELKVGKNKATELQRYVLEKITKAGGFAQIVTPENVELTIEQLGRHLHSEV